MMRGAERRINVADMRGTGDDDVSRKVGSTRLKRDAGVYKVEYFPPPVGKGE